MLSFALAAGLAAPVAGATAVTLDAQGRGHARASQGQKPKPKPKPKPAKGRGFDRDGHARVIREYAREGLPPGLAKREQLPPGLRRQIREQGELPPGLQKRLVGVPAGWSDRLPALERYERRYFAGNDLVVIDTRTNRIVAYLRDVLR